ncbi:MAG: ribosome biogenesis GTP-binding protein YihA/YsxC [Clostridia bacterium]|nr:ribosome biogenesis GTP-binding protein YihA/YsxC [Clostridia bacterium]
MNFRGIEFLMSCGILSQLPKSDRPEIVFSGKSNVGKSSLLNALTERKQIAKVSSSPGKTKTINFFSVEDIYFVDLPGYGYAKVSDDEKLRWANLMEGYFRSERKINLIVQILDYRHKPTSLDYDMLNFIEYNGFPYIIILTKLDKLNATNLKKRRIESKEELKDYNPEKIIEFSSENKKGVKELREIICSFTKE